MKHMLFAWFDYYPSGGMNDFKGLFNTVKEAEAEFKMGLIPLYAENMQDAEDYRISYNHGQIVNATSLKVEKEL